MRGSHLSLIFIFVCVVGNCDCRAQAQNTPQSTMAATSDCDLVTEATNLLRLAHWGGEGSGAARNRLKAMIENHPNSNVIPVLKALLENMDENAAARQFSIAQAYLTREAFPAEGCRSEIQRNTGTLPKLFQTRRSAIPTCSRANPNGSSYGCAAEFEGTANEIWGVRACRGRPSTTNKAKPLATVD